jgi:hypothetical protein
MPGTVGRSVALARGVASALSTACGCTPLEAARSSAASSTIPIPIPFPCMPYDPPEDALDAALEVLEPSVLDSLPPPPPLENKLPSNKGRPVVCGLGERMTGCA